MVLIISGTNRLDSKTQQISEFCFQYLLPILGEDNVKLLDLCRLNVENLINENMYQGDYQHPVVSSIQDEYLISSDKWLVISPEYNGGFSGILKLFIDAVSVRKYAETYDAKKIGLIGVSSGRAGNLRGMDQLTGIFHYLNCEVFPPKLPISSTGILFENNQLVDTATKVAIEMHLQRFLKF